jgi:hypothetical protein
MGVSFLTKSLMGTSANLLVKSDGVSIVHHIHDDAFPFQVFAQIAGTLGSCGIGALTQSLATAEIKAVLYDDPSFDEDNTVEQDAGLEAGFSRYGQACQDHHHSAFMLRARRNEHLAQSSWIDVGRGGVIPLFANPLIYVAWCSEKEAELKLDLDQAKFAVKNNQEQWLEFDLKKALEFDPIKVYDHFKALHERNVNGKSIWENSPEEFGRFLSEQWEALAPSRPFKSSPQIRA